MLIKPKEELDSTELIRRINRRTTALRIIELLVVLAVLALNIYFLSVIRLSQQQAKEKSLKAATAQQQLLRQAEADSARDHQETVRYLRCILLLSPPRTTAAIDACIEQAKLPDSEQIPPIIGSSTSHNEAGVSTSPKAQAPGSAPATSPQPEPTPQPAPTLVPQVPGVIQTVINAVKGLL